MDVKKPLDKGTLIGGLLVVFGGLLMLQTLGIIGSMVQLTFSLAFLAGGGIFLYVFLNDQRHWWALFPAAALGFIGLGIFSDVFFPGLDIGGPLFLGGLGLAFLVIYATHPQHLWAIIPGGALLTLATVAGVNEFHFLRWINDGTVFFLGLALTFALLYFAAPAETRSRWSWSLIVAAVLAAIGIMTVGFLWKMAFPIILIVIGVFLIKERATTK
ncbi:MAG TPA: hypothetical protein VK464_19475 [Symbiobacteriaceae bacterium]|nr:hypothetical protein [Symbiobacteriaceae bacterium]